MWHILYSHFSRLRIEFEPYDCTECHGKRTPGNDFFRLRDDDQKATTGAKDNAIFKRALVALFSSLSTWKKPEDVSRKGLQLELAMYSPSDSEHTFSDLNLAHDPYSESAEGFRDLAVYANGNTTEQDSLHPWRKLRRPQAAPPAWEDSVGACTSILKIMSGPTVHHSEAAIPLVGLRFFPSYKLSSVGLAAGAGSLPLAPVVTSLLLRRQYYRIIRPVGFGQLLRSLPAIETFHLETPEPIPFLQHEHDICKPQIDATLPRIHHASCI